MARSAITARLSPCRLLSPRLVRGSSTRLSHPPNVARPDMNNYATLEVMLYKGIGGSQDFALWDLARRATLGFVL
jgi:hypothetical protein